MINNQQMMHDGCMHHHKQSTDLWFDPNAILDHTARKGAADGEALENRSNGVTQAKSQQFLQWNNINFLQLKNHNLYKHISHRSTILILTTSTYLGAFLRRKIWLKAYSTQWKSHQLHFIPVIRYLMHVDVVVMLAGEHGAERGVETEAHESHWRCWEEELDESGQGWKSWRSQAGQEEKNRAGNSGLIRLITDWLG